MIRPLTIVAGKGGVGRSTVAAALAREVAAGGQRVLAVDAVNDGGLRAALATDARSGEPGGHVELLELTTELALDEYLQLFLKVPIPPSRVKPLARIFDYVATAAPGVREVLVMGKIAWEVREKRWDAVVVDAPATGHVIELLASADTLGDLISVGPLVDQLDWMQQLIADPETTGLIGVTTAEALPVSECLELLGRVVAETSVDVSGVVVTRVPDLLDDEGLDEAERLAADGSASPALALAARVVAHRALAAVEQLDRMSSLDLPLTWVPESADPVAATRQAFREVWQ